MPRSIQEFEARLRPNKNMLDEELSEQPELFWHVCQGQQDAKAALAGLSADVERVEAKVANRIRGEYKQKEEKLTEGALTSLVNADSEVIRARGDILANETDYNRWSSLREAFAQRMYALRELAELSRANYYQSSSVRSSQTGQNAAQREQEAQSARDAINAERQRMNQDQPQASRQRQKL